MMISVYTFFAHSGAEALAKPAVAALVALVFVDDAAALEAARVDVVLAHGAPEEPLAAVARRRAVVLAGGAVVADGTVGVLQRAAAAAARTAGRRRGWRSHGELSGGICDGAGTAGGLHRCVAHLLQNAATSTAEIHVTHLLPIYTATAIVKKICLSKLYIKLNVKSTMLHERA